ncbi:MAG: tRNA pseudouridine(55) synthase TruB [Eubacterium sp.]|nr:tRNA pseudouridine(55) synthase TruB [Eubacterium sp.]
MNGIINVYKEKGYTSHDVVAKMRRIIGQKKIGHTGTLDPDAEGVLPVCLGTATKVCELLTDKEKEYETVLFLGQETDTQDISGTVRARNPINCTQEEVQLVIRSFIGAYAQVPPMYSAIKVNGKKLYDLARAGIEVERKARNVQIFAIDIEWIRLPRVKMRVHCSKGTYIRTLCHDIGQTLGCGGCMESLLRTKVGIFELEQSLRLAQIQEFSKQGRLVEHLLPVDQLFTHVPKAQAARRFEIMLKNGNRLPKQAFVLENGPKQAPEPFPMLRIYLGQEFFGIYAWDAQRGDYKPVKIFWSSL